MPYWTWFFLRAAQVVTTLEACGALLATLTCNWSTIQFAHTAGARNDPIASVPNAATRSDPARLTAFAPQ